LISGENDIDIPVSVDTNGGSSVQVLAAPSGSVIVFDTQRDYGRSGLNGETLRGEWVCRLRPVL